MPSLSTDTQTEQITDATQILRPVVQKRLQAAFKQYEDVSTQIALLEEQKAQVKKAIAAIRDGAGVTSLELAGYKTTLVSPVSSRIDPKRLLAQGITEAQIKAATVVKPGASYEKVTTPKIKGWDGER